MPYRRLPQSNPGRDSVLTSCKDKMDNTPLTGHPFSPEKGTQLTVNQPAYHGLIAASNSAKFKQTNQSAIVAPLKQVARFWVNHGYQALINACIRGQFPNSVKNLYGLALGQKGAPNLVSDTALVQGANTYNDGETERTGNGGDPITFPDLADINVHVDAFKAANQLQSTYKSDYDTAQETLAAANPATDVLILQLWNSIEATYDTGDKPSMRRKAREWGVVYVPSAGEAPSGEDFSLVGLIKDSATNLPIAQAEIKIENAITVETYFTDEDGMFYLPTVPSGQYDLKCGHFSYVLYNAVVMLVEGEVQELNITLTPIVPPLPPVIE